MKAFITGATGFLGSHLVDRLLEKGWEVHVLARKSSNLRWLQGKNVKIFYGDVTGDRKGMEEGLRGVDVCFHAAGIIRAPRREIYEQVNVEGARNLLETVLKVNPAIKKVIVVTSVAAHGPARDDRPVTEEDSCHPVTDYGWSKLEEEKVALQYKDRFPITIIRPPAIYGPRDEQLLKYFKMVRRGILILPGEKGRQLNIAHVQDVVTGLILAAENPNSNGETFFIGDRRDYEWEDMGDLLIRALKKKVIKIRLIKPIVYLLGIVGELLTLITGRSMPFGRANMSNFIQKRWTLDISKARRILGYEPAHPLKEGFDETAKWYRENGWV
ncbi:MAG: NAD-dependent epimerase/dehydratase family protein [Deltaproteobacteria bacterium]|nr:NAD-dependent epimerase/dehydratase family protein [Deltaproteobacteria bacterium]